jgi:hypothetical protein
MQDEPKNGKGGKSHNNLPQRRKGAKKEDIEISAARLKS